MPSRQYAKYHFLDNSVWMSLELPRKSFYFRNAGTDNFMDATASSYASLKLS